MNLTSFTLTPLLSNDDIAFNRRFGPDTAEEKLDDYQESCDAIRENHREISRTSRRILLYGYVPDEEEINDIHRTTAISYIVFRQFQNFQRKVRLFSPHEVPRTGKNNITRLDHEMRGLVNASYDELRKLRMITRKSYNNLSETNRLALLSFKEVCEEFNDYLPLYKFMKGRVQKMVGEANEPLLHRYIPAREKIREFWEVVKISTTVYLQFQSFQRVVRLLAPHQVSDELKTKMELLNQKMKKYEEKAVAEFKKLRVTLRSYRPSKNTSSKTAPVTSPTKSSSTITPKLSKEERKEKLIIDTRVSRIPITIFETNSGKKSPNSSEKSL